MFFHKDKPKRTFMGVAIATLLTGAVLIALGAVEWGFDMWGSGGYTSPISKIIGGLIVLSLGYIHLELEMIRVKK